MELHIVQLQDPPLAGYGDASPARRGERRLNVRSTTSLAYLAYLDAQQARFVATVERVLRRPILVRYRYQHALNGLALRLSLREAEIISRLDGVRLVQRDERRKPLTDYGPAWIGAPGIWDGATTGGLGDTQGEGVIIGLVDTGINGSGHAAFAGTGGDGYAHTNPWGTGNYVGVCNSSEQDYDPSFPCNDKLIGAWDMLDDDARDPGAPRDSTGHGSHTASTAAGNVYSPTLSAPTVSIGPRRVSGVAPHANIVVYDACASDCPTSALVAAIDQAVADGVDVINYSISGGDSPYYDTVAMAMLEARAAGIFIAASAGNGGPDAGSANHIAPWVSTVAASTHDRLFDNALLDLASDAGELADIYGQSITASYGPARIVYAGDYGNALCSSPFPPGTWSAGEIVACERGGSITRITKGTNVQAGGAGGLVLMNQADDDEALIPTSHVLPAVDIGYQDSTALKSWLASGTLHTATIAGTVVKSDPALADVVAGFSARGPSRALPDVIKPDLAAPGVMIWAATNQDNALGFLNGTSMSAPHLAGGAALLRALHPDWTPAEIQSALVATAQASGLKQEGSSLPVTPFDTGSGRLDLGQAVRAGFVLDESAANYRAANPDNGGDPKLLNTASLGNAQCAARCAWTRVLSSTLPYSVSWSTSTSCASGLVVTVTPPLFELGPFASQSITIQVDASAAPTGTWQFGRVSFSPDVTSTVEASFPLAVRPTASALPGEVTIQAQRDNGSWPVRGLQSVEVTSLTIKTYGWAPVRLVRQQIGQDSTPYNPYDSLGDGGGFYITATVSGSRQLVAEASSYQAHDVDLYVGRDSGDGAPQASEQICASQSSAWKERCTVDAPADGTWWVLAQNVDGSASPPDELTLALALVPSLGSGGEGLQVEGPASVPAGKAYDLRVYWDIPALQAGERRYGLVELGSTPDRGGNLGAIALHLLRYSDDVSKTANTATAYYSQTITYTLLVRPSLLPEDVIYTVTDSLPGGLIYLPGTLTATRGTAGVTGTAGYASGVITWEGVEMVAGALTPASLSYQARLMPGILTPTLTNPALHTSSNLGSTAAVAAWEVEMLGEPSAIGLQSLGAVQNVAPWWVMSGLPGLPIVLRRLWRKHRPARFAWKSTLHRRCYE